MKKKGFTLIELLAVIVILAIIALIATPLVLKYIEKSRKESKVDSASSFVRNLETEIANYSIKHNGKKYNGQPTDKGYYELTSFENSEINTTVKGDKPNSIKVCLSSLGQVDKAMFEYGKYYVSYDGKKGSISDKDTYDSFSCDENKKELKNALLTVGYDENYDEIIGVINELDSTTFYDNLSKNPDTGEYSLIIKDKNTGNNIYQIDLFYWDDSQEQEEEQELYAINLIHRLELYCNTENCTMVAESLTDLIAEGDYYVDLVLSDRDFTPYTFKIDEHGVSWLIGTTFVEGDADILITDADKTVYFNGTAKFKLGDGATWLEIMSYDYKGMGELPEVYNAIANGKIITIRITQTVDGKDVVTTIVGNNPVLMPNASPMNRTNIYALGNELWPIGA